MSRTLKFIVLLFCSCVAVPAVYAQKECTLQTLTGTYAVYEKGASSFLNLTPPPSQFPYFSGVTAPFVNLGELTFSPDGVGTGFYWIKIGALNGGFAPIPDSVTVTEMNPDCTGKIRYTVNLTGISATIEERFFVFDEGREIRSVPTSIQQGIGTLAWFGVWRRIGKSSQPVHSCGPQTAHGTYLLTAENIVNTEQGNVADALFIREDVSLTGDYTGTLYEKLGPLSVDGLPVTGKYNVNPDCSFTNVMVVVIQGVPVTVTIDGVFYNEGQDFYALAMDLEVPYSFIQGKRIGP
jgi:hypothetical protein